MTIFARFGASAKRFADGLNTHHVFGVGLGTALGSLAIIAANGTVSSAIAHVGAHGSIGPLAADVAGAYWNTTVAAAQTALPAAIVAAAFSRPPNVPSGPITPSVKP